MHTEEDAMKLWCPMAQMNNCIGSACAVWRWGGPAVAPSFTPVVDAVLAAIMGPNNASMVWSRQKSKTGERIISAAVEEWERTGKPGWFEFVSSRGQDRAEGEVAARLLDREINCEVRIGRGSQYPFSIAIQEKPAAGNRGFCGLAGRPS